MLKVIGEVPRLLRNARGHHRYTGQGCIRHDRDRRRITIGMAATARTGIREAFGEAPIKGSEKFGGKQVMDTIASDFITYQSILARRRSAVKFS